MKSPRDILLKKHEGAEARLNQLARAVVQQTVPQPLAPHARLRWTDWLWPSPVGWGAVAAAWLVVIGFNIASRDPAPQNHALTKRSPEMMQAWREQRRMFVELVAPSYSDAVPARVLPRPRSDRQQPFAMA